MFATLAARNEPDHGRRRRRGCPIHRRDLPGARRRGRAGQRGRRRSRLDRRLRPPTDPGRPPATVDYVVRSPGVDGLHEPDAALDCGNSGTSLRLFAGILAGLPFPSALDGDDSLRRRPVARIIEPLRAMGATLTARSEDSLPPLAVIGRHPLRAIDRWTAVPSAQVKSAILLAGLRAEGWTTIRESVGTRDHTERMLRARGIRVTSERLAAADADGRTGAWAVSVEGGRTMTAIDERVPGDVSAAAFWLVAAAIHPDADLVLRDVGVNPTRRAVIDILRAMGADIEERPAAASPGMTTAGAGNATGHEVGEPLADLRVRSSALHAIDLGPDEVAAAIDEIPILCLAASRATGTTHDPGSRRAPPQGVRSDRRDRCGPDRDGQCDLGRGRRPPDQRRPAAVRRHRRTRSTTTASP